MEENAKLERFFGACEELITGKFILADSKIGELLRAVATSDALKELFNAVTEGFDFPAAKKNYLKAPDRESGRTRGEVFLPADRTELVAFVFCLLVEFDNGQRKLGDFLLTYFYEDGSYTASYELFVNSMIRPFRDIVKSCFPQLSKAGKALANLRREESNVDAVSEKVVLERNRIASLELSEEDAMAAEKILSGLYTALGRGDLTQAKALLCGYLYFLQVIGGESEESEELFRAAARL